MTIIAEKENVAKNYIKALKMKKVETGIYQTADGKIKLTYAAGHLYTSFDAEDYDEKMKAWSEKNIPYIPKAYRYKPIREKAKFRTPCEKLLRNAIREKDEIVIATDPDREGEVIARLILDALKADYRRVTRIWNCEGLDEKTVLKGIKERKSASFYDRLALKGLAAKNSDWVFGINLTRAYTILNNSELFSIGRVQSAILKEIYRNEMEINLFISKKYYECKVTDCKGNEWYLMNPKTNTVMFDDTGYIEEFRKAIKGKEIQVNDVIRTEKQELPPRLYDLAGLQMDAFRLYGIKVKKTLEYAQSLYNEKGVMSYPRTDSVALNESDEKYIRELYETFSEYRSEYQFTDIKDVTKENRRIFNSEEITGHHALIPNRIYQDSENEDWKIWDLVLRRFLMQGMGKYIYEEVKAYAKEGEYLLRAEGKEIKRKGWKEAEVNVKKRKEVILDLCDKERIGIKEIKTEEKYTRPPERYNEASLVRWMKNPNDEDAEGVKLSSIGTEATRAGIIQTLFKREYVEEEKKHIRITKKGIKIVEQIMDNPVLNENLSVETTTRWEKMNEEDPEKMLREIEGLTVRCVERIRSDMQTVVEKKKVGICPSCSKDVMRGKNGYYCAGYKEGCKFNLNYKIRGNDITDEFVKELIEKKESPVMNGVTKEGEETQFQILINEKNEVMLRFTGERKAVAECPKCSSDIYAMNKVYKCSSKECDFFLWKDSSGVRYDSDMVRDLCQRKSVKAVQTKKDGSTARVTVKLSEDLSRIELNY